AMKLASDPNRVLSVVQIGMTGIGVLSGIVGQAALVGPFANVLHNYLFLPVKVANPLSTFTILITITYFTLVIGELVPKRIGQLNPAKVAPLISRPVSWLMVVAAPFVKVLAWSTNFLLTVLRVDQRVKPISEEEIHSVIDEGEKSGAIDAQEHALVKNIFRLDDRAIASMMIPRSEVEFINLEDGYDSNMKKILKSRYFCLPVCDGNLDNTKGILTTKTVLEEVVKDGKADFSKDYEPVVYIPESLTGMELLEVFRKSPAPLALVVDEYGSVLGLVSPYDVLEAIAGEFVPNQPEDAQVITKGLDIYEVDGLLSVPELKDLLKIQNLPEEDENRYTTVGGFVMFLLERIPRLDDKVSWNGWEFHVVGMDGRRLDRVMITKLPDSGGI
ncbi:MAG: hemolysin family protein, partial [Burkholderiales bacterium]|nr:hemolysin family protein [Burkholderiales bacterium]